FTSKMDGIDWINLDLLALTVDSVTNDLGASLTFTHVGELLHISLPDVLNEGDQYLVNVWYHGSPENDTTWGGFYFASGYAYNMGVGFDADPHNFGRVWFPCFDNFVERSTYEFNILTSNGKTAYCNGLRAEVDTVGLDSLLTRWVMDVEIPSYLANVAVSDYVHVEQSFDSVLGSEIPVWIAAKSADTTEAKLSMTNLLPALTGFENDYGPYRFPRVGYVCVPFNGGAMEHATNISYPLFAIDGTLTWETLWAHELSHMWWGDLVTCHEAGEMWLNEGWAKYSEALFLENIYGYETYIDYVLENHKDVILHAHQQDGERFPVSPVPHEVTYGSHVYNKGADMVHTLRGYMGDEAFFTAVQNFLTDSAFTDIYSTGLRDYFQDYTESDLEAFFDNWIFAPGYPEFRIEHFDVEGGQASVSVSQHRHYSDDLYSNVPLQLSLIGTEGSIDTVIVASDNWNGSIEVPEALGVYTAALNRNNAISQAVFGEEHVFTEADDFNFDYAEVESECLTLSSDSLWIRMENHLAEADFPHAIPGTDYIISPDRWWRVDGNIQAGDDLDMSLRYFGNGGANDFDPLLFEITEDMGLDEDSLVLLYRPRASDENGTHGWQEWSSYELNTVGSTTNWTGRFDVHHVLPGDYAFALQTGVVGLDEQTDLDTHVFWFNDQLTVRAPNKENWTIFDSAGRLITRISDQSNYSIDTSFWPCGTYYVKSENLGGVGSVVVVR
ncbi:MAG: M1 family metallopeptidase, partial [Flavobacteriales bacterium]|nr:M1 family metallopeptidase [Flavobacteriales bacterium]